MMLLNPYRFGSDLVLMLHFDGSNGSTVMVDSSSIAKTVTALSGAQLDTSNPEAGTAACLLSGTFGGATGQSAVSVADHPDFDLGDRDFEIAMQVWITELPTVINISHGIISKRSTSAVFAPFNLGINYVAGVARLVAEVSTSGVAWISITGTSAISTGQYYSVKLRRTGGTLDLLLDEISEGTAVISGSLMTNSSPVIIGAGSTARDYGLNGWIDELSITRGAA